MSTPADHPASSKDAPPFFIVGAPRSGTTMLRLMFNEHPDVCVPGESHFVVDLPRTLGSAYPGDGAWDALRDHPRFKEWRLNEATVADAINRAPRTWHGFFTAVFGACAEHHGVRRWGDKTPIYARDLPRLHAIFPEAHVIHIVRDGRDVTTSLRSMTWFSDDVLDCATRWAETVMMAHHDGTALFGEQYHAVRYEDLVNDPASVLAALCEHLGLAYDERMLRFHEHADQYISAARQKWHTKTREKISSSSVGRYREALSTLDVALVESVGNVPLKTFDYPMDGRMGRTAKLIVLMRRAIERLGLRRPTDYRDVGPLDGSAAGGDGS